jgi:MFS family permease
VENERLVTWPFALIVASGLAYFLALAMLNPIIPVYVDHELNGGGLAVGAGVGAFALGAVLLRPVAGAYGDRHGRRRLLVAGAATVGAATLCYGLVASLWWLVLMRIVAGVGEAAFWVGAATMITDRAPESRRGEALSYWSVAVYGGLAFGPYLGELVVGSQPHEDFSTAWIFSASLAFAAVCIGLLTREAPDRPAAHTGRMQIVHRAALRPGVVLMLGQIALAGWSSFVKLYGQDDLGMHEVGGVFLTYGVLILLVRVVGARLPDQLGARRAGTLALTCGATGMLIVAAWRAEAGLYAGTAVFAIGMSLMYPALLVLALDGVPASERGSVVGTFSSFFDLSQGLGAALCGLIVSAAGYGPMFATTAVLAVVGIGFLRRRAAVPRVAPAAAD